MGGNYKLVTSNTGFDSGKVSWKIKANSTPDNASYLGVATVNRPGVWEMGHSDKRLGTAFFLTTAIKTEAPSMASVPPVERKALALARLSRFFWIASSRRYLIGLAERRNTQETSKGEGLITQ